MAAIGNLGPYIGAYGEALFDRGLDELIFRAAAWATGTQVVRFSTGANELIGRDREPVDEGDPPEVVRPNPEFDPAKHATPESDVPRLGVENPGWSIVGVARGDEQVFDLKRGSSGGRSTTRRSWIRRTHSRRIGRARGGSRRTSRRFDLPRPGASIRATRPRRQERPRGADTVRRIGSRLSVRFECDAGDVPEMPVAGEHRFVAFERGRRDRRVPLPDPGVVTPVRGGHGFAQ